MNGFVCIDKPAGPTSFAVVKHLRRLLREPRAGHAGTLDPGATGVLVIALGTATRLLPFLPAEPKVYRFGICFGAETDTLDASGAVIRQGGQLPAIEAIREVLPRFIGEVRQEPPRYSSIKVQGERAYKLARNNRAFELPLRTIRIQTLTLDSYDAAMGEAALTVACSSGTYVRSLARDIARALGALGHAAHVRRTQAGQFTIEKAVRWEDLRADLPGLVLPVREVFRQFAWVTLPKVQQEAVRHGSTVRLAAPESQRLVFGSDESGELVAVLQRCEGGAFRPLRVFA